MPQSFNAVQTMEHLSLSALSLLQFTDIMNPLLITATVFSRPCSHKDSDLGYKMAIKLAKMNSEVSHAKMPLKSAAIIIFKFYKIRQQHT